MNIIPYIIMSILAILLGQIVGHLNKKMPPVVAEEITYKEFFKTFKQGYKLDILYTIIFLLLFNCFIYFLGNNITSYLYVLISVALAITFSIDLRFQLIPDEVHIVIIFAALINLSCNLNLWWNYLLGGLIGAGIFWLLGLLSLWIFKKEGMGFGDVKLMGALGLMFGIKNIIVITLISFVFGAIIGALVLIFKKKENDGYIPFGPFIVLGTLIIMFIPADVIIDIYIAFCSWLGMKMSDVVYFIATKLHLME